MHDKQNIEADIDFLLTIVMDEIRDAFKSGDGILYGQLADKYGPLAHKIYMALDAPSKSSKRGFFDKSNLPIPLDPFTVIGRKQSLMSQGKDLTVTDQEFWFHSDMIKTLADHLSSNYDLDKLRHDMSLVNEQPALAQRAAEKIIDFKGFLRGWGSTSHEEVYG